LFAPALSTSSADFTSEIPPPTVNGTVVTSETHGTGIRIFPALNIKKEELEEGLAIMHEAINRVVNRIGK